MPGVSVTLRNVDTNGRRSTVTDSQGRWRIVNLPVGNYEATLELTGFATILRSGLTLSVNQNAVVDAQPEGGRHDGNDHRARPTPRC